MLCKKHLISFGLLLSGLFSVLLSCSCYAIDDFVINYDSSSPPPSFKYLCTAIPADATPSYPFCRDYNFLIIDTGDPGNSNTDVSFSPFFNNIRLRNNSLHFIFNIHDSLNISSPFSFSCTSSCQSAFTNVSNFYFRFTFTNSLPGNECPEPDVPVGSLSIDQNGTYDVTDYSEAVVNVPQVSDTPYDEKLDEIKMAILLVPAVLLLIYFFYCIYRMLIKGGS